VYVSVTELKKNS